MKTLMFSLLIPLAAACSSSKADPSLASNPASPAGAPATATAAPGPGASPTAASPTAAAPAGAAQMFGPIPLAHTKVDFAALFPSDEVGLAAAEKGEGSMPGSPASIIVRRSGLAHGSNGDIFVTADLKGKRITRIEVYAPGMASPNGIEVGASAAAVARAVPGATCQWGGGSRGMLCSSERDPAFTFQFNTSNWGDDLASAPGDATVAEIIWDAPKNAGLTLKRRPTKAKAGAGDVEDEEETPLSSADCAMMVSKLVACGTSDPATRTWLSTTALGAARTPAALDAELAGWGAASATFCSSWDLTYGEAAIGNERIRPALHADCAALRTALGDLLARAPNQGTWLAPVTE